MKKLFILAVIAALLLAIKRAIQERSAWRGLTEAEVRSKLEHDLPSRMPADKIEIVSDKVVAKMRDRGVLREDGESEIDLTETQAATEPVDA